MTKYEEIEQEAQRIVTKTEFFNDVMKVIKSRIVNYETLLSTTTNEEEIKKFRYVIHELSHIKNTMYSCADSEMMKELSKDMFN